MGSSAIGTTVITGLTLLALVTASRAALGKCIENTFRDAFVNALFLSFFSSLPSNGTAFHSQDSVREADGLRLPRNDVLQREEPVPVRVSGLVPRGGRVSGGCVLVRRKSFGADAGHPVPAAERDSGDESRGTAAKGRQHVLHDEASDQIR